MQAWRSHLREAVDSVFDDMVVLRRQLHMYPEPSGEEFDTSQEIYTRFLNSGFDVRQGPNGCGVIADVPSQGEGGRPLIALRADMDALRIQDEKEVPYRSRKPSLMHACGHDAHTAAVWGALLAVSRLNQRGLLPFAPRIRGIFQPAEETAHGALQMIECGAVEGIQAILAMHVDPSRRLGRLGLRTGILTASCDGMLISVIGRGGHAARPHEARDPILAAAQLINSVYLQVPRLTDSQDAVVVTVGRIDGGHNANVIPERVELRGTLRTLDESVRDRTKSLINQIARAVSVGTQTRIEVRFGESTPPVDNHGELVELLWNAAAETAGPNAPEQIPRASMGSEDFSYYGKHAPAAMFRLGCVSDRAGGAGLHTPTFDIDEESLRIGALVMSHSALSWLERYGANAG